MAASDYVIIGNWKQHPVSKEEAKQLFLTIKKRLPKQLAVNLNVVVAPPFPFLAVCASDTPAYLSLGAQDVSVENGGAHTGEVSVSQLASCGVSHIIIGHSERRAKGETDALILEKVRNTLAHKRTPVVCIGEQARDTDGVFFSHVEAQVKSLTNALTATEIKKVILAYEPIWAIGTGKTATVEDVKEMQLFIHSVLTKVYDRATASKVQLVYGGSVKAANAAELHAGGGMRGFLVGGASLIPEEFISIVKTISN